MRSSVMLAVLVLVLSGCHSAPTRAEILAKNVGPEVDARYVEQTLRVLAPYWITRPATSTYQFAPHGKDSFQETRFHEPIVGWVYFFNVHDAGRMRLSLSVVQHGRVIGVWELFNNGLSQKVIEGPVDIVQDTRLLDVVDIEGFPKPAVGMLYTEYKPQPPEPAPSDASPGG